MLLKDAHVHGAFFVCPTYNELILEQKRIGIVEIPRSSYFSIANPQGVAPFESHLRGTL